MELYHLLINRIIIPCKIIKTRLLNYDFTKKFLSWIDFNFYHLNYPAIKIEKRTTRNKDSNGTL